MKKNMKKLLVIVMALMPGLSINSFAQDPGGNDGGNSGGGTTEPEIPASYEPIGMPLGGIRPRTLPGEPDLIPIKPFPNPNPNPNPGPRCSVQEPYCYHIGGVVYIEADTTITYINATITRYDDNQVWSDAAASNTLSISASSDIGTYALKFTLSDGKSYIGEYIIE